MNNLLEVREVSIFYKDFQAVYPTSLAVVEGSVVSIIGSNGAGKSTLMKAICGLKPVRSGEIFFKGENVTKKPAHEIAGKGLVMIPEGGQVFPRMTVKENLLIGAYMRRARGERHTALGRVYDLFPVLREKECVCAGSLSGGQRQMVAIGRALMEKPDMILFDEISLGLAPTIIKDIYARIREISRDGTTIVLVEQDIKRSMKCTDTIHVMLKGRINLQGCAREIPEEEVKKAYFGL